MIAATDNFILFRIFFYYVFYYVYTLLEVFKLCVITFDWENNDSEMKFKHFDTNPYPIRAVIEITNYNNFKCLQNPTK